VRGLQSRSEQRGESDYEGVWTFRIERYDEAGNRMLLVPVEMRSRMFEGSISDGDWVRAHGKMKAGTFRANTVENFTTGASVRAKRLPQSVLIPVVVIAVVFFLAVLSFVLWGFATTG
jgi:hypothetical protein